MSHTNSNNSNNRAQQQSASSGRKSTLDLGISCLPGYQLPIQYQRNEFKKNHLLDYKNGYSLAKNLKSADGAPSINLTDSRTDLSSSQQAELSSLLDKTSAQLRFGNRLGSFSAKASAARPATPDNVKAELRVRTNAAPVAPEQAPLDTVILRFEAYLRQDLPEGIRGSVPGNTVVSPEFVIRRVIIQYFMVDDSIAVVEPSVNNSGLQQGVLIRRQLIPKPNEQARVGESVSYYTIDDFQLGKDIVFYNKTFHITACDKFTEQFMTQVLKSPVRENPAEPLPVDPYIKARKEIEYVLMIKALIVSAVPHHLAHEMPEDKLKRFLENDRKVLRFYCAWDDRASLYGELREYVMHYFLVDDSIEVREVRQANSGRDPFPIMLRRQKMPKALRNLDDMPGATPIGTASAQHSDVYTWRDLAVGKTIDVLGRQFLLYNCDGYTREFLIEVAGLSEEALKPVRIHEDEASAKKVQPQHVEVKKTSLQKLLENDGKVLRFLAFLDSHRREDRPRRFVLSFRLADDTISVFEPPVKNAGLMGGKFAERASLTNPNTGKPYDAADFYVGATIEVYRHKFVLLTADEYVFNFMEQNAQKYPQSNFKLALEKLRAQNVKASLQRALAGKDKLPRDQVIQAAKTVLAAPSAINEHEIITVVRKFESNQAVQLKEFLEAL